MTEKEWLEQSDEDKNDWISGNVLQWAHNEDGKYRPCNHLNWQGFGMVVEESNQYNLIRRKTAHRDDYQVTIWNEDIISFTGQAPTPWEAAALAYGKMKGLMK